MIHRAIRQARKQMGLTQRELAAMMEVSQGLVSMWERDPSKPRATQPNPTDLARLSRLLDVSLERDVSRDVRHSTTEEYPYTPEEVLAAYPEFTKPVVAEGARIAMRGEPIEKFAAGYKRNWQDQVRLIGACGSYAKAQGWRP